MKSFKLRPRVEICWGSIKYNRNVDGPVYSSLKNDGIISSIVMFAESGLDEASSERDQSDGEIVAVVRGSRWDIH